MTDNLLSKEFMSGQVQHTSDAEILLLLDSQMGVVRKQTKQEKKTNPNKNQTQKKPHQNQTGKNYEGKGEIRGRKGEGKRGRKEGKGKRGKKGGSVMGRAIRKLPAVNEHRHI